MTVGGSTRIKAGSALALTILLSVALACGESAPAPGQATLPAGTAVPLAPASEASTSPSNAGSASPATSESVTPNARSAADQPTPQTAEDAETPGASAARTPTATDDQPSTATGAPQPTPGTEQSSGADEPSGDLAKLFELPNAKGELVSLESYRGDRNVVLVFYRGFW